MKFPNFVYRCPGSHQCPGGTYDHRRVSDEEELQERLDEGWSETLPEALGQPAPVIVGEPEGLADTGSDEPEADEVNPPTRVELEEQARFLGLKFNKKDSDEKLLELVTEALAGGE